MLTFVWLPSCDRHFDSPNFVQPFIAVLMNPMSPQVFNAKTAELLSQHQVEINQSFPKEGWVLRTSSHDNSPASSAIVRLTPVLTSDRTKWRRNLWHTFHFSPNNISVLFWLIIAYQVNVRSSILMFRRAWSTASVVSSMSTGDFSFSPQIFYSTAERYCSNGWIWHFQVVPPCASLEKNVNENSSHLSQYPPLIDVPLSPENRITVK